MLIALIIGFVTGIYAVSVVLAKELPVDGSPLQTCLDYELKGYIPVDSCACAQRLHADFSHSYDWMDACKIEKATKKPA